MVFGSKINEGFVDRAVKGVRDAHARIADQANVPAKLHSSTGQDKIGGASAQSQQASYGDGGNATDGIQDRVGNLAI